MSVAHADRDALLQNADVRGADVHGREGGAEAVRGQHRPAEPDDGAVDAALHVCSALIHDGIGAQATEVRAVDAVCLETVVLADIRAQLPAHVARDWAFLLRHLGESGRGATDQLGAGCGVATPSKRHRRREEEARVGLSGLARVDAKLQVQPMGEPYLQRRVGDAALPAVPVPLLGIAEAKRRHAAAPSE